MLKFIFLFLFTVLDAYEAKVEPFEVYKIKASVAGEVVYAGKTYEARNIKNTTVIKLDDAQNVIDLKNLRMQKKILLKEIENLREMVKRKKETYEKYKNLKTKSKTEKDLKFYDYMNTFNQLLNLRSQLSSTIASIEKLNDVINKKRVKINGYLYKIYVNRGDYVAPGTVLAEVYDVSEEKITVYVPIDEIENVKNKRVYINGKESGFKIYKIWNVPDKEYITSYKVELIGKGMKMGEVVKVEFK